MNNFFFQLRIATDAYFQISVQDTIRMEVVHSKQKLRQPFAEHLE